MESINPGTSGSKRWLWVGIVVGVLLLAGAVFWWYQSRPATQPNTDDSSQGGPDKTSLPDNQTVPSSDKVPDKTGVSVSIARLEQTGNDVIVEGNVTGASDGSCVAEFTTPQDNPVNGEAKLTENNTKCGPITLPAADFAFLGEWSVKLTVYTGGGKAESQAKTITIK
jgi:hypothetical protein